MTLGTTDWAGGTGGQGTGSVMLGTVVGTGVSEAAAGCGGDETGGTPSMEVDRGCSVGMKSSRVGFPVRTLNGVGGWAASGGMVSTIRGAAAGV